MNRILLLLISAVPGVVLAHTGQDASAHHGFLSGLAHPFTGFDHMSAMIAVGVWSVLAFAHAGRARWVVPGAFAALLLTGGLLAMLGMPLPGVEPAIAASLVVLGVLVATRAQLPLTAGAALIASFALFHGVAHGTELASGPAAATLAGMVLGTVLLHVSGMALGQFVLARNAWLPRLAGIAVALFGASLLSI
jgi:urease accessory protein